MMMIPDEGRRRSTESAMNDAKRDGESITRPTPPLARNPALAPVFFTFRRTNRLTGMKRTRRP